MTVAVPRMVLVALALLVAGWLVDLPESFGYYGGEPEFPFNLGFIAAGTVLTALLLERSYRGRNWARIVLMVLLGLGPVLVFTGNLESYGLLSSIGIVLNGVGTVLLWTAPSNAYFEAVKAAHAVKKSADRAL